MTAHGSNPGSAGLFPQAGKPVSVSAKGVTGKRILYVHPGRRDPTFERLVYEDLAQRFTAPRQTASQDRQDGMTTVTLEFSDTSTRGAEIVAALKIRDRVEDAAEESFGEGA